MITRMNPLEQRRKRFQDAGRAIAEEIRKKYPLAKVIGFGSTYEGDNFSARSDIDLAVDCVPNDCHADLWNIAVDIAGTEEVDICILENESELLREQVAKYGVIL